MKRLLVVVWSMLFMFFGVCPAFSEISTDGKGSSAGVDPPQHYTIMLAHHVGNRPDWLSDPENVHGGRDYSDWDPSSEDAPPEPGGQPEEDPRNDDSGNNDTADREQGS